MCLRIDILTLRIFIVPSTQMMVILTILAIILVAPGVLYWIIQFVFTLVLVRKVRSIDSLPDAKRNVWPRVSVIMPARNESDTIEAALRVRLGSNYPNLELIIVNDRSTDDTGQIADRIASEDNRVRVIHVDALTEGWIGKLYAMQIGAESATGEWLLFSDVDVHVKPGTLRRVIAWCEDRVIDHMAVIPDLFPTRFFVDVTLSVFMRHICVLGRPWKAEDKKSNTAVGAGAFNLVRRTAFDAINGFEKVRLTVTDDVAFGRVLKQSGIQAGVLNGRKYVRVYFYRTIREMAVGSERALFTMFGNFSMFRLIIIGTLMLVMELTPFIALFFYHLPLLTVIGISLVGIVIITSLLVNRYLGRPWWTAFFVPVAIVIMYVCMIRAGILGKKRGGIIWRGTFYSSEMLREYRQS